MPMQRYDSKVHNCKMKMNKIKKSFCNIKELAYCFMAKPFLAKPWPLTVGEIE